MTNTLRPEHTERFERFGVPLDLVTEAGVRSVTNFEARDLLAMNGHFPGEDLGGIYFPSLDPVTGNRTGGRVRVARGHIAGRGLARPGHELPIKIPARKTSPPPTTTCSTDSQKLNPK